MNRESSIWSKTADIPPAPVLTADFETDVAIIGAGMAGMLTAYALKKRGVDAVVFESSRIGSGQTKNTTAKITCQHGMCYDALVKAQGAARARQYAQANQRAIAMYGEIIRENHIDCDFLPLAAHLYSTVSDAPLRREAECARDLGIDARYVERVDLPFETKGAVRFEGQAQFHPLKFLSALSSAVRVFEGSHVLSVQGGVLKTRQGTVRAKRVVFACHFPFVNVPGWYFLRMHQQRSYVVALEGAHTGEGTYISPDADGFSFRTAEGALLMGGGDHRTGENSTGGRYDALLSSARALFPGCREIARWSAQDCVTLDGVPYIGRFSADTPEWYVATGFAEWGMTSSMVSSMLLSDMLTGEDASWGEVFSPQRFDLSASARNLATETVQAFKGLTREALSLPRETLDQLPVGHGGIVEVNGVKVGVYKEDERRAHIVHPRCPHLGCELTWNPDEKSWDCPCHGSRFHFDGTLLDGPALRKLSH